MLDDKYRVERLLAIGGMGAVYVGTHTKIQKKVAIKVLRTELASAAALVERFQREAIAASAIGHDNIVSVTDMGQTAAGVAFLVMEFLEGESLHAAMQREHPFPVHRACDLTVEVLSAIAAAHEAGIVHRDLKPENVFLARRSHGEAVKILDFGISRIRSAEDADHRLTRTGLVMGTPNYMSPEQARGETEITGASDIYSIGVMLYEMVCDALPYEAENYNMLMYRVLTGEFLRPRARRPDLPEELDRVIVQAMAMDPAKRFPGADDFAAALAPFTRNARLSRRVVERQQAHQAMALAGTVAPGTEPTMAAPSMTGQSMTGQTVNTRRRSQLAVWAVLGALVLGLGIGGAILFSGGGGDPQDEEEPTAAASDTPPATTPPVTAPPVTAPPVTAPPVDPPPVVAPTPAEVEVAFDLSPARARLIVDGQPVDGKVVRRPAGHVARIQVVLAGYASKELDVTFDVKQRLQVNLERERPRSGTPGKPGKPGKGDRIITDSPYE